MIDLKAHLKELCELHGTPGYEAPIRAALERSWGPLVDSLETGIQGDLIALKRGTGPDPRPTIMLCAHMDEIGLIVKYIDRGFLRVSDMGGVDPRTMPGLPVLVHGRQGSVPGVVALPARHDPEADNKDYPTQNALWIDLGLPESEVNALIRVGDVITMDTPMVALVGDRMAGKAVDDRSCIVVLTAFLEALQSRKHAWDVMVVASTQEETGTGGAALVAEQRGPDCVIALDVTFATQPGLSSGAFDYGAGVPVSLGANFHPALYEAILKAAERIEIKTLPDPLPAHSGTDAWAVQIARAGIPCALLNLVVRNMHTTVETVSMGDLERTARLLSEFVTGLAPDFLESIVWDKS